MNATERQHYRFFRERRSYPASTALAYAKARAHAEWRGWEVVWEPDDCFDWDLDCCEEARRKRDRTHSHEVYCAVLYGPEDDRDVPYWRKRKRKHLASLGGIVDPGRDYMVDVEADLVLEAVAEEKKRPRFNSLEVSRYC